MNHPPSLPGQSRTSIFDEFEAACRSATDGLPSVEDFLSRLPADERPAARETLERIAGRYRSQNSDARYETVDPHATSAGGSGQTVDHWPATDDGAIPLASGTVDEAEGRFVGTPGERKGGGPKVPGYVITGELGRGGMGVVYKAHHVKLDRVVALKMILGGAHVDRAQLTRFYTEAQAVARLQHPGIVQIFEIDEHDGLPYFSLEFVDGGSLAGKIKRVPQPPRESAALLEQIARAIQAAHERGIIHRDLKPANVLMTKSGTPKVTDFGLARRLEGDAGQTQSGTVLGTPNYMAPEQARGEIEKVGPLADVYSLGAMLYEMLTGRPPFQGTTVLEVLDQVGNAEPVPPAQLSPGVPKDLETVCLKCLQKDPARRYESAGALADDLRRFLEGRPIVARPVSRTERLWRLCLRNKRVAGLTATVALLFLTGGIAAAIAAVKFRGERDVKVESLDKALVGQIRANAARETGDDDYEAAIIAMRYIILEFKLALRGKTELVQLRKRLTEQIIKDMALLSNNLKSRTIKDRSVAAAHVNMGELYVELGEYSKSKEHFDEGEAILARLLAEEPETPVAVRNLATVTNHQGNVAMRLQDGKTVLDRYAKALELRKRWAEMQLADATAVPPVERVKGRPTMMRDVYEARLSVAQSHGLLGGTRLKLGDPESALGHYLESQKIYDAVPAEHFEKSDRQLKLDYEMQRTDLKRVLGTCLARLGRTAEARTYLAKAVDEAVGRVVRYGKNTSPGMRYNMILCRWDLGDLELLNEGNPVVAEPYYRSAAASAKALAESPQAKDNTAFVEGFAYADYRMGYVCQRLAQLNQGAAAAAWAEKSKFHFDRSRQTAAALALIDPADTNVQILALLAEARCGRRTEALARIDALRKQVRDDGRVLFHSACAYAILSGEGGVADVEKALTTLEAAVAKGWKEIESLRRDPDLDALRGHPRVVALEKQLVAAARAAPP